jgi:hypothetical protein
MELLLRRSAKFFKEQVTRTDPYQVLARHRHGTADLMKVGFPKSGNTWVHFLMANTVVGAAGRTDDVHFKNLKTWVGGSEAPPSTPPVDGFPSMIGHHRERHAATYLGGDTTVVYIVRHPGDVMESFYDWRRNRWVDMNPGSFSEFIRSENGITAWARHVRSWQDRWDVLITFEDLKDDPASQLRKIWTAVDLDIDESTIQYAVEQSSFSNMQRMEEQYGKDDKAGGNPEYTFMRKGESDAGEAYFDSKDRRYLEETAGDVMETLGYSVDTV